MSPLGAAVTPIAITVAGAAGLLAVGRTASEALAVGALLGLAVAIALGRKSRPEPIAPLALTDDTGCENRTSLSGSGLPPTVNRKQLMDLAIAVADLNPDALVLFSEEGTIRYANAAARELFFEGVEPEGKNFLRLLTQAPETLRELLLGESDRLFSVEIERQPETFHLTRRSYPIAGNLHTLVVVKHLTREVARREVQTLKNVVRVISHEVNNSLAPIASLVHSARLIAERPEHAAKLGSVFDTIEERASHLRAFLEGYAGLARLPAPEPVSVDWQPLSAHLFALYPKAKLFEPPAQPGYFDPVQIEQVLINLVKNAAEAGSSIEAIEVSAQVESDGTTRIEIADRGPGFSEEALCCALLPFYSTKEKGSGMGLALCREIVEAHAGSLVLANREGGGALVSITLPGKRRPDAALARSRAKLTLSRT